MNYYEHHIRDYDAATAHLSWDEDMAYTRLLRWYYRKEGPPPGDVAEVCRLMRSTSKVQRAAVESVLREFFELRPTGWHHNVCDAAIAKFKAGEPERDAKKNNEAIRLTRHREERAALFATLNKAGQHLPWNVAIQELRAAVERIQNANSNGGGPASATPAATAPATPATATHPPSTSTHSPEALFPSAGVPAAPPPGPPPAPKPRAAKQPKDEPVTNEAWDAYAHAYKKRYGADPVRNASVNGQLAMLVQRIGREEAPNVARFYLAVDDPAYLRAMHSVKLLLADAEALRTRWFTARTQIQAAPQSPRAQRAAAALAPLGLRIPPATEPPKEIPHVVAG